MQTGDHDSTISSKGNGREHGICRVSLVRTTIAPPHVPPPIHPLPPPSPP